MILKNGLNAEAPFYKNYSYVILNDNKSKIEQYYIYGFVWVLPNNSDLLNEKNFGALLKLSLVEVFDFVKITNDVRLWRPIEKEEVECVFSIQQTIIIQGKEYRWVWIEDGKGLVCNVFEVSPQFGKPYEEREYYEHYGRVVREYFYFLNPELIDSILFKKMYYNLDLFGEKKYLDESHSEEFTLDMRNPDMAVYEYIRSHGLLEIDWEK